MPAEVFGPGYAFLPREEILSFEEIERLLRLAVRLGVRKVRLTGGEPLLRRGLEDLVAMLAAVEGVEDLALTTNGVLLAHHAEGLALAGVGRVTVSLDALDAGIFSRMNGTGAKVERVLAGISAAQVYGLPVKVNAVVKRGVNESEILPLAAWGRDHGVTVRFIEYMDVGETNGWRLRDVVPASEIRERISGAFAVEPLAARHAGEVARRFAYRDGAGEVGFIASVTEPFCGGCTRLRLSADGNLFTCLFAARGTDLRAPLREGAEDEALLAVMAGAWSARRDRYSEERGGDPTVKAEMSYLGG